MPLTPEEKAELAQLEALGPSAPQPSKLTPDEQQEMAQLEAIGQPLAYDETQEWGPQIGKAAMSIPAGLLDVAKGGVMAAGQLAAAPGRLLGSIAGDAPVEPGPRMLTGMAAPNQSLSRESAFDQFANEGAVDELTQYRPIELPFGGRIEAPEGRSVVGDVANTALAGVLGASRPLAKLAAGLGSAGKFGQAALGEKDNKANMIEAVMLGGLARGGGATTGAPAPAAPTTTGMLGRLAMNAPNLIARGVRNAPAAATKVMTSRSPRAELRRTAVEGMQAVGKAMARPPSPGVQVKDPWTPGTMQAPAVERPPNLALSGGGPPRDNTLRIDLTRPPPTPPGAPPPIPPPPETGPQTAGFSRMKQYGADPNNASRRAITGAPAPEEYVPPVNTRPNLDLSSNPIRAAAEAIEATPTAPEVSPLEPLLALVEEGRMPRGVYEQLEAASQGMEPRQLEKTVGQFQQMFSGARGGARPAPAPVGEPVLPQPLAPEEFAALQAEVDAASGRVVKPAPAAEPAAPLPTLEPNVVSASEAISTGMEMPANVRPTASLSQLARLMEMVEAGEIPRDDVVRMEIARALSGVPMEKLPIGKGWSMNQRPPLGMPQDLWDRAGQIGTAARSKAKGK